MGFIQDWQTAIVGGLGFLGVMATLWFNARLSRGQFEREQDARRRSLRTALLAELNAVAKVFEEIATMKPPSNGTARHIPKLKLRVAPSVVPDLGLLSQEELDGLMDALIGYEEAYKVTALYALEETDSYIKPHAEDLETVLALFERGRERIRLGITALETGASETVHAYR